jgi:hypothetical protein
MRIKIDKGTEIDGWVVKRFWSYEEVDKYFPMKGYDPEEWIGVVELYDPGPHRQFSWVEAVGGIITLNYVTSYKGWHENIRKLFDTEETEKESERCACDLYEMMREGCKCGGK